MFMIMIVFNPIAGTINTLTHHVASGSTSCKCLSLICGQIQDDDYFASLS